MSRLQAGGLALFLFIPVVLYLFVAHPRPVGASLAAGVVLMLGHRFLARPYMERARTAKCLWCNRMLPPEGPSAPPAGGLDLATGAGPVAARCCPAHRDPAARFFTFLHTWRWPLRLGIFLPLLLLLATLAATAFGRTVPLEAATALFRLVIGITVNVAGLGYLFVAPREPLRVPFPAHNFFLLGVRALLWIFRLIGIWWIVLGAAYFLRG